MNQLKFDKAYIVTVDMGYGHQRAVHPLKDIAANPIGWNGNKGSIITANTYPGIPSRDRRRWEGGRSIYEKISRMKHLPIVGNWIFGVMNYIQRIEAFYPQRDLSKPTIQVKQIYSMIRKGWGEHLIETLNKKPLPMINSFFSTAFFAEEHGYKGEIYCICTDTDISRAWVPLEPHHSRIKYLAPNRRVKERLKQYGVSEKKIFITGFPLPKENIGGKQMDILKECIGKRICNLDPEMRFRNKYRHTLEYYLGKQHCYANTNRPLTITFAVGGAGAQREIGATILQSLHKQIRNGEIRINLVAGSRNDVFTYYDDIVEDLQLNNKEKENVYIIFNEDKLRYFNIFNKVLLTTDILWTKPSELSFYAGLGLPIIMAPVIGSQEESNHAWLSAIGAGVDQQDPRYTHEWLPDWLSSGWLAQAAMKGFLDAPRNGAYHIEEIVTQGVRSEIEDMHLM